MKKSPLTSILLGVLTLSTLASVYYCWVFISSSRQKYLLQGQAAFIAYQQNYFNSLVNDAREYSRTHPDIDPVLEHLGLKQGKTNPPTGSKPATK